MYILSMHRQKEIHQKCWALKIDVELHTVVCAFMKIGRATEKKEKGFYKSVAAEKAYFVLFC